MKKWFTLIEVLISTSILTIAVFWVYKMISENNKIINNSNNYITLNNLNLILNNCIENTWFLTYSWSYSTWEIIYYNIWQNYNLCGTDSTFTWFTIDWIEYNMYTEIMTKNIDNIELYTEINWSGLKTLTWSYILIDK